MGKKSTVRWVQPGLPGHQGRMLTVQRPCLVLGRVTDVGRRFGYHFKWELLYLSLDRIVVYITVSQAYIITLESLFMRFL
jgi:hypothetical protein